jgi:hypothetical protein
LVSGWCLLCVITGCKVVDHQTCDNKKLTLNLCVQVNVRENWKGLSRIDNPETLLYSPIPTVLEELKKVCKDLESKNENC